METQMVKADAQSIARAAEYIRMGEVVGFPTETVYGLGAKRPLPAGCCIRFLQPRAGPPIIL